jgi:signal transduction histidine kinase
MEGSGYDQVSWREARRKGLQGTLLACFVFLLCYFTAELAGILKIGVPEPVWPLWPGCALLTAILLLSRAKLWPVLLSAGLAGFVLYDLQMGLSVTSILWLMLTDVCEILTASVGVRSLFDEKLRLGNVRGLAKYCAFAVFLAPILSATLGAARDRGAYWVGWRLIFFSEALAFLTVPPAILGWAKEIREPRNKPGTHWLEAAILMLSVFGLGYVLSVTSGRSISPALFYALVPFLIWSALRFGPLGVSTSILIVAFLSIWGSIHGRGAFTASTPVQNVLSLQLFLLCAAVPFMVLAALSEQHKRVEATLRELSGRLITAQEEERGRISRELHDDLSQKMARLLIRLERWRHGMGEVSAKSGAQFDTIVDMTSEVSASLRDLSHLLHPATLATLGLVPAMAALCRTFSEQHHVTVRFDHREIPKVIPPDLSLCLFRVVQETLRNVVKHSHAQEARVALVRRDGQIELCVEDFGCGFEMDSVQRGESLGLISMRERARLVGGELSIDSEPGRGTRVFLRVPHMDSRAKTVATNG